LLLLGKKEKIKMALRLRRGTSTVLGTITPAEGELVYTTDTKRLYVGDGVTVGGISTNSGYTGSSAAGYTGSAGVGFTGSTGVGFTGSTGAGYTGSAGSGGVSNASVPTHSTGSPGDVKGMSAVDSTYIYYCTANYVNGVTADIWKRTAHGTGTW
jgi:hypothetical protein